MPNDPILICLPWNTKNYTSFNAFNPLYSFLLENSIEDLDELSFVTLNEAPWKDYLTRNETKNILDIHFKTVRLRLPMANKKVFHDYWTVFDLRETMADELSQYDFKIIHTSLLVCGLKPYIFHIESFDSLFFPWKTKDHSISQLPDGKITAIKDYLQATLEHPKCMAITSHLPLTIERFKQFFNSEIINTKLHFSPIGIPRADISLDLKCHDRPRRFIFSLSLTAADDLTARGIIPFFLFIQSWRILFPNDQFVFLSNEPDYSPVAHFLSKKEYDDIIRYENMLFIGGKYIDDHEFCNLLKTSDYIFLLTHHLDSFTLLKSMSHGIIPIVIDSPEVINLGINENNAVLLNCYHQIKHDEHPTFGQHPTLESFIRQTKESVPHLINKLIELRKQPELENIMSKNAIDMVNTHFNVKTAKKILKEIMLTSYLTFKNEHSTTNSKKQIKFAGESRFGALNNFLPKMRQVEQNDFNRRPIYHELLSVGTYRIYEDGQHYIDIPMNSGYSAVDIGRFTLSNENGLHELRQANLSYENALETVFYKIHSNGRSHKMILKRKLKQQIMSRPILKNLLMPLYHAYKKLKSGYL